MEGAGFLDWRILEGWRDANGFVDLFTSLRAIAFHLGPLTNPVRSDKL